MRFALVLLLISGNVFAQDVKFQNAPFEAKLKNYFDAMKTYVTAFNGRDKVAKEEAELSAEEAKFEVTNHFVDKYFQNAFRESSKDFDRAGYEADLRTIQKFSTEYSNFVAEVSVAIQEEWNLRFFDIFEVEQRRVQEDIRRPVRRALLAAGIAAAFVGAPGAAPRATGMYFKAFKTVFPVRVSEVTLRNAATVATVVTVPVAVGAVTGGILYKAKAVKEIPTPPAQFLTLTDEPAGLALADLEKEEFVKEVISSVASIAGTTWFMWILMGTRLATIGLAGTGIGLVLGVAASLIINEIVMEAGDLIQEVKHKGALVEAMRESDIAYNLGDQKAVLRAVIKLMKATYRLSAFYQYQVYRGEMTKEESDTVLGFQVLDFLGAHCTSEGGCASAEDLVGVLAFWKSNSLEADKERRRRKDRVLQILASPNSEPSPAVASQAITQVPLDRLRVPRRMQHLVNEFMIQYGPKSAYAKRDPLNFRERLQAEKRMFEHKLHKLLYAQEEPVIVSHPEELLLQVASYIRSLNRKFLNQFARKLETQIPVEPLLVMSIHDEGVR